jgi:long-chain-fatty-acid--[acyl-carrier-protein] ligase
VDVEASERVRPGETGMLLLRGPSIFSGYLHYDGPSPFVSHEGRDWYGTGDLVSEDDGGVLTFHGRLKRFVKIGGEMVSLPAIESVLQESFAAEEEGPVLAVTAAADETHPKPVLITTVDISRESANRAVSEAGLSALHNIRRVIRVEAIPTLGTGKADYRALEAMLD